MNRQRAQQIVESPDMKHVSFNGTRVYIQHVDEESETARIYPLDDPSQEKTVSLNELHEE
ncbi:small acid-soluble spore protein H [Bacillus carboniphilus]|uniref:Small, acid-soluble spore protein H n=1 Tax=Bacillus carboniphilus TaxID=86663 RepID=A0ABP3FRI4_9BACI